MNDKDKEAFDKWWEEKGFYKGEGYAVFKIFRDSKEVWEYVCEYKQKEIDELKKERWEWRQAVSSEVQFVNELQPKLKEALEVIRFYANSINYSAKVDYKGLDYISIIGEKHEFGEDNGKKAREFLKKLEGKNE